ncbi:RNA polymerase sigma factor RpoE [hydrothermal vent metagenome]|uniref:RNA polymerase sigma factor RpoE n=1 Tax=hydrothermal vent metagenome TaxID=652676 RepID=A0A3B0TU02_9ZZZZ
MNRITDRIKSIEICNILSILQSYRVDMKDAELVQQVLNGNSNAFRFLVSKHQRLVIHIVGRVVQQQEEIEDICQEVFMKVFQKLKKFRGDSKLSTWIATIAYNTSISHFRRNNRYDEASYDELPGLISGKTVGLSTSGEVEKEEVTKYLMQLIEQLPVHYRTVLTLFHLDEFSYAEIGQITKMPEGTIKSYLSRARKLLKEKIEKIVDLEKTNIFVDYVKG